MSARSPSSAWAEAAWPEIDFAQHRARYTAYVQLLQDESGMRAIVGNEGDAPTIEWFVGGSPVGGGVSLPSTAYASGDDVRVRLTSDAGCVPDGRRVAEATRVVE